ncbi:MAG: DUF559 domain-containing protein, partial [Flavobacteriales bacterium]|nr:DUF559 domain-containing protein [Flavobacteriales bacterium]
SAEAKLWSILKSKQLEGRKFRRQHSINNYLVYFFHTCGIIVISFAKF